MIKFLYADSLHRFPQLADAMFRDRAIQFRDRLNWSVQVDDQGHERDHYDAMNPLYVIAVNPDGSHGGSMRFLPTTAETMVNDHFLHLTQGVRISSPLIWECTRFCLSPSNANSAFKTAGKLLLAGCELGLRFGLHHAVGVFDGRMLRVYRRLGWQPLILGSSAHGPDCVGVGLWAFDSKATSTVAARIGLDPLVAASWFEASFPFLQKTLAA